MIEIYDNVVPVKVQDKINKELTDPWFPWYLSSGDNHSTVSTFRSEYGELKTWSHLNIKEYIQFVHFFWKDGPTSTGAEYIVDMFKNFCKKVNIDYGNISRIKANLQTQCNFSKEDFCNTPHMDHYSPHIVGIYYVNNSDGNTNIFDTNGKIIKSVEPIKGRFLIFDGNYYHAGRHPISTDKRIVINFNFYKE
jgi:hypothetical protein